MKTSTLTAILKVGGITNIIGSPLIAVFYHWIENVENRPVATFPVWIYSFFYCTTILGLFYIQAAKDPVRHRSFVKVAVIAKVWGILACAYAVLDHYHWMLLVGVYDVVYGVFFYVLYRRVSRDQPTGSVQSVKSVEVRS